MKSTSCKCRLCHNCSSLRKSHVLPEFVYRPAYDLSHTAITIDLERGRRTKRQKGYVERMLCGSCEQRFSKWESYFAKLWLHPTDNRRPKILNGDTIVIPGVDYAQFKLFHLSLVWRSGVSTLPAFANVKLGGQEPKLRKLLLASDPGRPEDYPFFGMALKDPDTGGFQDAVLKLPDVSKVKGHHVYTLIFAGVVWHYFISSHAGAGSVEVLFDHSGKLTLGVQLWTENEWVRDMARSVQAGTTDAK